MGGSLKITVLGTASCIPEPGRETASFCLNGTVVVDTGWCVTHRLTACGIDPLDIEAVLLTHCHHDHYMGLLSLLFWTGLEGHKVPQKRHLQVIGPAGHVGRVVEDAFRFLQTDRYPELSFPVDIRDVAPGGAFEVQGLRVTTAASRHNVPGLHYRIETDGGASVVFSGDTPFNPDLVELAQGADLLVHEASHGAESTRGNPAAAHSGAPDAAEVAALAGVKRLWLVHCPARREGEALEAARMRFPAAFLAQMGAVEEFG